MDQSIDAIAKNLRTIREARNLSLVQLSHLTGVSKSKLRQIETEKSSPTIATIWKIANGLRVSFTTLLRKSTIDVRLRSFKGATPLTGQSDHYRLFPLMPFEPQQSFKTYYVEIDHGAVYKGEPHDGNVYEYVFAISGKLQISAEEKEFEINEN
jgi:transcriptional regulator with XRE-family HTH domain